MKKQRLIYNRGAGKMFHDGDSLAIGGSRVHGYCSGSCTGYIRAAYPGTGSDHSLGALTAEEVV